MSKWKIKPSLGKQAPIQTHWPDFVCYPVPGKPDAAQVWVWGHPEIAKAIVRFLNAERFKPKTIPPP